MKNFHSLFVAMCFASLPHLTMAQSKPLEEKDFDTRPGSIYDKTGGFYQKTFWVHSPSNKASREILVILPKDYFKSTKKYPVILYFNGITQKPNSGASVAREFMIPAIQKGKVKPMIWAGVDVGKETMCADSKDGKIMMETWVNKEAIPWIDANFRTLGDAARGIEGNSQGGFCALLYANKYPDLYKSVVAWCPALWGAESFAIPGRHIDNGHDLGKQVGIKMYDTDVEYARKYNPWNTWNLNVNKLRKLPIHILVGNKDKFRKPDSVYAKLLDSLGVPVSYNLVSGAKHGANSIQDSLPNPFEPYEFHSKHLHGTTTSIEARVVRSSAPKAEGKQAGKLVLPGVDRYRREAGPGYDARGVAVPGRGAAEASEAVGSK